MKNNTDIIFNCLTRVTIKVEEKVEKIDNSPKKRTERKRIKKKQQREQNLRNWKEELEKLEKVKNPDRTQKRRIRKLDKRLYPKKKRKKQREHKNRCPTKYQVYIKSIWWKDRKNRYYQKYNKQCVICGSTKYINLHHLIYKDFGNELDEHLVAFCKGCHEEFHTVTKLKKDMIKETNEFIISKRELLEFPKGI